MLAPTDAGTTAYDAGPAAPIESVTSADGTRIRYRTVGSGPAAILIHGTMSTGASHDDLARSLANGLTVIVPDRRSIDRINRLTSAYGVRHEIEDVRALMAATGARRLFGVSSGAIIALEAALAVPEISQVAGFEPPLFPDAARARALLERLDVELAAGRWDAALVTGMLGAELGPGFLRMLPRGLLERMTRSMMDRPQAIGRSMAELAPVLHDDFTIVSEASGDPQRYAGIRADVLILSGTRSPLYLRSAVERLGRTINSSRRTILHGLDHSAPLNTAARGDPQAVARELLAFFGHAPADRANSPSSGSPASSQSRRPPE
jgi:pimeloyl-ACP methyl ester carboxylesterase